MFLPSVTRYKKQVGNIPGNIPGVSHLPIFVLFSKPMKFFKVFLLLPQLIYQAEALYASVQQIDHDPTVKAAFDEFKTNPVIAMNYAGLRMQVDSIKSIVDQLKSIF